MDPDFVFGDENIPWLSRENVEDRTTTGLTGLPEMVSSGQSVGSVVCTTVSSSEQVCFVRLMCWVRQACFVRLMYCVRQVCFMRLFYKTDIFCETGVFYIRSRFGGLLVCET